MSIWLCVGAGTEEPGGGLRRWARIRSRSVGVRAYIRATGCAVNMRGCLRCPVVRRCSGSDAARHGTSRAFTIQAELAPVLSALGTGTFVFYTLSIASFFCFCPCPCPCPRPSPCYCPCPVPVLVIVLVSAPALVLVARVFVRFRVAPIPLFTDTRQARVGTSLPGRHPRPAP